MRIETLEPPDDEEYCQAYKYETTGSCTVKHVWVDENDTCWLISNDGQKVAIPGDRQSLNLRSLIAKRVKEATYH